MVSRQQQYNNLEFCKSQVDTLKIFNDNVIEIKENEEYCVPFESGGRNFLLNVKIGPDFPNVRPTLVISPPIQHNWVNPKTGEINSAPGLLNYTPHSDLGRVVQAIIREYERFPPSVVTSDSPSTNTSVHAISSNPLTTNVMSSPTHPVQPKSIDTNRESLLDNTKMSNKSIENSLPNLSSLSLDELKQLDTDPEFFDDFIEEMCVVQHLNEDLDSMINQVDIISRENESKETQLVELKRKLSDDVTALKNLGEKCDELNKKYLKKSEEFAPQHIRELLQIAASNADTECDRHVELFLNGKIDVQTFLNNYTLSKKISSERKAKEERLGQQLSALERAGI